MEGKLVKIIEINILHISVYIIITMNAIRILNMFKQTSLIHVKAPLGRWNVHNHRETTLTPFLISNAHKTSNKDIII